MLRFGAYGDHFVPWRKGLRLRDLESQPSGVDLGPMQPRLVKMLERYERRIELAPSLMLKELERLERDRAAISLREGQLLLIGRRDIRTNNSWLHNTRVGTRGRERCTLQMHPDDASVRDLSACDSVQISSRIGRITAPLELTDKMMPGVVSLPHGWGHHGKGLEMQIATQHPGVNCNELTDDAVLEPVVGNAVFNGVPVVVEPV
jgi:anaerobic selenocysteine-containing dehydrogenase